MSHLVPKAKASQPLVKKPVLKSWSIEIQIEESQTILTRLKQVVHNERILIRSVKTSEMKNETSRFVSIRVDADDTQLKTLTTRFEKMADVISVTVIPVVEGRLH